MFLSTQAASSGQIAVVASTALSPDELANLWLDGKSVYISSGTAPRHISLSTGSRSGFVFVRAPLLRFSASEAQRADFTDRYCSVMVASIATSGEALFAFKLPELPKDGKAWNALLRGLDVTYGGKASGLSRETEFGFTVKGERQVLIARNRELDEAAISRLMLLGRENSALQTMHAGYIRSGVTVAPDSVVTLASGESQVLAGLEPDTEIFCPVHVDSRATAVIQLFAVGGPVVQCHHCQRVFPGRASRPSYDFGLFDRTVERLARELPTEVTREGMVYDEASIVFHSHRYLPTLDLSPGITFVKSPKGSGKTEALKDIVARCKKQRLTVLVIGHRRSLLQSLAHRLGVDNYRIPRPRAIGSDVDDYLAVPPGPYYAVCLDSLGRLNPKTDQYDVIVIDESEQVFAHLIGETVREERRAVFARLKYYLDKAEHVFCLDADLNMISMQAAFVMMQPETSVRIIINQPEIESRPYQLCGSKGQLLDEMLGDVRDGYKCFVATNSKRQAQDIERLLMRECPGRRIVTITSENSQSRVAQQLLSAIVEKLRNEIDVLIASPAMGTGVDITFLDAGENPEVVVDRVFGLFEANITTHFDLDQHLMRVRHPGQVKVWVNRTELNYETDVACLIGELNRSLNRTNLLLGFTDDGTPQYLNDDGLTDIWAQVQAANRGSKNSLAPLFENLRVHNGWVAVDGLAGQDFDSIAIRSQAASNKLRAAKAARANERAQRIAAARLLGESEVEDLIALEKAEKPLTAEQALSLERFRIERFYGEEISEELVTFDNEGRTREQVRLLELVVSDGKDAAWTDLFERHSQFLGFDRQQRLARRELLRELFTAAGLMRVDTGEFDPDARVSARTLSAFALVVREKVRQVDLFLGKPVRRDLEKNPVGQLTALLGMVGLELEEATVTQRGGKKMRAYRLRPKDFKRMSQILDARRA
jgi:hypothetical protein